MGISGIRSKQLRAPYGVSRARWVNGGDTLYVMRALLCQPIFAIFEFYAHNYNYVSTFECLSNLGTMPTSFGIADVTG